MLSEQFKVPLLMLRCEKLPKNALVELEIYCNKEANKMEIKRYEKERCILQILHENAEEDEESKE